MLNHCFSSELEIVKHSWLGYQRGKESSILNTVYLQKTSTSSLVCPLFNASGKIMLCSSDSITIMLFICCALFAFVFFVALA